MIKLSNRVSDFNYFKKDISYGKNYDIKLGKIPDDLWNVDHSFITSYVDRQNCTNLWA